MRWEFSTRRRGKNCRPYSRRCFDFYVPISSHNNFYSSCPHTKESSPKCKRKIDLITCHPYISSFELASVGTEVTTKAWAVMAATNGKRANSIGRQFTGRLRWATSRRAYQKRRDSSSNLCGRRITSEILLSFPGKEKPHNLLRWNRR